MEPNGPSRAEWIFIHTLHTPDPMAEPHFTPSLAQGHGGPSRALTPSPASQLPTAELSQEHLPCSGAEKAQKEQVFAPASCCAAETPSGFSILQHGGLVWGLHWAPLQGTPILELLQLLQSHMLVISAKD